MKIEKIAENKIRIIFNREDFKDKDIDLNLFMSKAAKSQNLLLMILDKAQKEVNFNTDGCKLLIEGFLSDNDTFIFTITKFLDTSNKITGKKLIIKRKLNYTISSTIMYKFNDFEEFCLFCNIINYSNLNNKEKILSNSTLYLYNNEYYLIIHKVNINDKNSKILYNRISEFSNQIKYSINFENKLKEHGKVIINKNAIYTGIKYFSNKTIKRNSSF